MRLHHLAYAVEDIDKAADKFGLLGFVRDGEVVDDESRGVKIVFMELKEGALPTRIELVAPLHKDSPVAGRLEDSKGVSVPYHLCFEVDELEEACRALMEEGFLPISKALPAPAIRDAPVQFFFSGDAGLIELVEVGKNEQCV